ncbi:unnamed protein product [Effrenium voratum]|uniref:Uncharacterized protein n=1 Tax=Effrenium voratum TaxID=2562239 RepID=A0AA36HZQ3_9DINO|nr:unnamed protein product [Effrenium voratum]
MDFMLQPPRRFRACALRLRGTPSLRATPAATAWCQRSAALGAGAADEYLNYNMTGEYTPFMIIGYFGLTTFLTAFAFGSYLILTKLKII